MIISYILLCRVILRDPTDRAYSVVVIKVQVVVEKSLLPAPADVIPPGLHVVRGPQHQEGAQQGGS